MIRLDIDGTGGPERHRSFWGKIWDFISGVQTSTKYEIAKHVFYQLSHDTPVLTGWARASWSASVGSPNPKNIPRPAKGSSLPPPRFNVSVFVDRKADITIVNDAPHIERLNAGWSEQQAAPGFINRSIMIGKLKAERVLNERFR